MWATALRELKYHPARYIATLLAIAISVGFMAASSIATSTESHAMAMQVAAPYSRADVVIAIHRATTDTAVADKTDDGSDSLNTTSPDQMTSLVGSVAGVAETEPLMTYSGQISVGEAIEAANLTALPSPDFQTLRLKEGALPEPGQIVLNSALMQALKVKVGDPVTVDGTTLTVSGVSDDPAGRILGNPGYINRQWYLDTMGEQSIFVSDWIVRLADGAKASQVVDQLESALEKAGYEAKVQTRAEFIAAAATQWTHDIDAFKYILWVFAGVAMIVGLITIANTFTILLTGRRRQIGLIRTIGATGGQVRHSIWAEAAILGLVGGAVGVGLACGLTALLGLYTGSIHFGITIPWTEAIASIAIGLVITIIACVVPARRATTVSPMEALQPASGAAEIRRVSIVRSVVCGLFFLAGAAGSVLVLWTPAPGSAAADSAIVEAASDNALLLGVTSAMCLAIGILFGARLFVPGILRVLGAVVRHFGSAGEIAAKNVVRDPRRASATATALMLAVGLIITLQVGSASVERTITTKMAAEYPVDLTITSNSGMGYQASSEDGLDVEQGLADFINRSQLSVPSSVRDQIRAVNGVDQMVDIPCKLVPLIGQAEGATTLNTQQICRYVPQIATLAPQYPATMPDDQLWVGNHAAMIQADGRWVDVGTGSVLDLPDADGNLQLTAKATPIAQDWVFASPTTYDRLKGSSIEQALVFADVSAKTDLMRVARDIMVAAGGEDSTVMVGGTLQQDYLIGQIMDILVGAMTALLAVAVLIALVGVGNTLTLSVIERSRESAILRAVGAKKSQLRAMLLLEALLLTLTGAIVGLLAGGFFGFLGAESVVEQIKAEGLVMPVYFSIDWIQTLGLIGILVIAAVGASLLPGRRAASASPVEALADV